MSQHEIVLVVLLIGVAITAALAWEIVKSRSLGPPPDYVRKAFADGD